MWIGGERVGFERCEDRHNQLSASAGQERRLQDKMIKDLLRYNQMGVQICGREQELAERKGVYKAKSKLYSGDSDLS